MLLAVLGPCLCSSRPQGDETALQTGPGPGRELVCGEPSPPLLDPLHLQVHDTPCRPSAGGGPGVATDVHPCNGSGGLTTGPVGVDSARECQSAGLTDLVVAVHQDNAKVGGLEPAPALHDNVVALADVIYVHRNTGICPCNAQGPGVPQPARHFPSDCGLPFTPTCHGPLVLSPSGAAPSQRYAGTTPGAAPAPSYKPEDDALSAKCLFLFDRGSEGLRNSVRVTELVRPVPHSW